MAIHVRTSRRATTASLFGALAVGMAACGGGGGATATTANGGGGASTSAPSGSGSPTTGGSTGGSSQVAALSKLESKAGTESKATFKLTYTINGSGGPSTVTLEQAPPDQLLETSGASSGGSSKMIYNGSKTYICSGDSGKPSCLEYSSSGATPLASLVSIYDGSTVVSALKAWQSEVADGVAGYHMTFAPGSYAGQSATCVNWTYAGDVAKYCVTASGILAYASNTESGKSLESFSLSSYSGSAPRGDFALPSGATVITEPAG